jgi:hypothetical protein
LYSKEQASKLRQAFWTTFGQYMVPIPSANGVKINWVNYKTDFKYISFKMDADKRLGSIAIEITHPDPAIQALLFEQFQELRNILHDQLEEEWHWQLHTKNDYDKTISRISTEIRGVSIFKREDWPKLISFFKSRIIALDEFWSTAKYSFDALR